LSDSVVVVVVAAVVVVVVVNWFFLQNKSAGDDGRDEFCPKKSSKQNNIAIKFSVINFFTHINLGLISSSFYVQLLLTGIGHRVSTSSNVFCSRSYITFFCGKQSKTSFIGSATG